MSDSLVASKYRFAGDGLRGITIQERDDAKWAVVDDGGMVLDVDCTWVFEPQPSSRTREFLARTRFPFRKATTLAAKVRRERGNLKAGDVFNVPYPFVLEEVELFDGEGPATTKSWRPGVEYIPTGYYGDSFEPVADGMGEMRLTIVSVHKPGKYPTRVFFVRQWVDPNGKLFGKTKLRMTTATVFASRARGYREEFSFREPKANAA